MQRRSAGGRERLSHTGGRNFGASPNTRSSTGAGRRSFLPRPAGSGGLSSTSRPNQRLITDNGASRLSRTPRGASNRLSALGASVGNKPVLGSAISSNRLSVRGRGAAVGTPGSFGRVTPIRNVLTPTNSIAPGSVQSNRESRASSCRRRERQEPRPIADPVFKKQCVDRILSFLANNGFGGENATSLNRRMLTNPTTKDFTSIFNFIYCQIVPGYQLPARFEEEIPRLLKFLGYPVQISKNTFIPIGTSHSWPAVLAMLSWLCDIVDSSCSEDVLDLLFPFDVENDFNAPLQNLLMMEQLDDCQSTHEQEKLYQLHVSKVVEALEIVPKQQEIQTKAAELASREIKLRETEQTIRNLQETLSTLESNIAKLDEFIEALTVKIDQLDMEATQVNGELERLELSKTKVQENIKKLSEQKARQNYSPAKLLYIKNHADTSAAEFEQLQLQHKDLQGKIDVLEMKQCRMQVLLVKDIQAYNCSAAASLIGTIGEGQSVSCVDEDCTEGTSIIQSAGAVAARLKEFEVQQLINVLREKLRCSRTDVTDAEAVRAQMEADACKLSEQAEEKKKAVVHLTALVKHAEEELMCCKQELLAEETAMTEELRVLQNENCELRQLPRQDLISKQQNLAALKQRITEQEQQLTEELKQVTSNLSRCCLKMSETLHEEQDLANKIKQHVANSRIFQF